MKRLKKAVYSAFFAAGAVHLVACAPETVYGPPPSGEVNPSASAEEVPEVGYGPTEMPSGPSEETSRTEPQTRETKYDPAAEEIEDVYGPPPADPEPEETADPEPEETAGPEEEVPEVVYGPPEYFSPQPVEQGGGEVAVTLYGPPAAFEK